MIKTTNNSNKIIDITEIEDRCEWERKFTLLHPNKTFTIRAVEERMLFFDISNTEIEASIYIYKDLFSSHLRDGKVSIMYGTYWEERQREKVRKRLEEKGQKGEVILGTIETEEGKKIIQFSLVSWDKLNIVKAREFSDVEKRRIRKRELELKMSETKEAATEFRDAETEFNKLAKEAV